MNVVKFPPVHCLAPHGSLKAFGAQYDAAKAGDIESAIHIVNELFSTEQARELCNNLKQFNIDYILPILAKEAKGSNMLPFAFALTLGEEIDAEVYFNIIQISSPKRTGRSSAYRLTNRPAFQGDVAEGSYFIVDDSLTLGGTIMSAAKFIIDNGGVIAGFSTLTGYHQKIDISLDAKICEEFLSKETESRIANFCKDYLGFDFHELTKMEFEVISKAGNIKAIMERMDFESGNVKFSGIIHHIDEKHAKISTKNGNKFNIELKDIDFKVKKGDSLHVLIKDNKVISANKLLLDI